MNSKIRLDFCGMMSEYIGKEGITAGEIDALKDDISSAYAAMNNGRGRMKWRDLPHNQDEIANDITETAERVRKSCDDFVVLGIGGSALGPIAVQQALNHLHYNDLPKEKRNGPRLFVEDNVDPERMAALFDVIDLDNAVFNVITKSGSTSETMTQLLVVTDALKAKYGDKWGERVIATTDRENGNLIKIARENGLKTYFVPDGVGGRFSELCPVGLVAAAVCGIDIKEMLRGAAYADELSNEPDIWKNAPYMAAVLQVISMRRGKNISVMMPYADSLKYMSDWYAQLWAESLGKRVGNDGTEVFTGQTPVKALGVTDQHSQVQLYVEGPFDKVVTFLGVDEYRTTWQIPKGFEHIKDVSFLCGHTMNELIQAEQRATEYALTVAGRPNFTLTLPSVNAFTVGQLLYFLEIQTAFAGELLKINTFDQPGVEGGKQATYALLGKPGFDGKREELRNAPKKSEKYVI